MRYPLAVWRPWTPYKPERYITPRVVIVHTNAVNAEDPGPQGTLSWHFQVGEHGTVYQHRDTNTRAAANADANGFAISIETWDGGDPEGNPWNTAQLTALDELIGWCCDTHDIPRSRCVKWDGDGVGYHRMFPEWNQPAHSCPGDTRVAQFPGVLARLQKPEGLHMDPEVQAAFDEVKALIHNDQVQDDNTRSDLVNVAIADIKGLHEKVDDLTELVRSVTTGQVSGDVPATVHFGS